MFSYVSESVRWSKLRRFSESKLAQAIAYVPLIGFAFMFNEKLIEALAPYVKISSLEGFRLKLELFYIGLSLFGVAVILYKIFGPSLVKSHESLDNFVSVGLENVTQHQLVRHIKQICILDRQKSGKYAAISAQLDSARSPSLINENTRYEILSDYYNSLDLSVSFLRYTIAILMFIGAAIALVPSAITFFRTLLLIIDRI